MATIEIRFPHRTTLDDATKRARVLIQQFATDRSEFVKELKWPEGAYAGTMDGRGFDGRFNVTATEVRIDIDLSLLTRAFKGKVETRLLQKLEAEFGKA
jgi:hypothetical protein